jgi:thiamine biosynthesis lipoprotein
LVFAYAQLENRAVATSGNYFNYRESNGIKYSHSLNPKSGYPIKHQILSATIFADDCMTADGWATAAMVMGHEKMIALLDQHPEIKAMLLYTSNTGEIESFISSELGPVIKINPTKK